MEIPIIKVIAIDPGGTTGWAKGLIREGRMGVTAGQDEWNHIQIYNALDLYKPDIIVCERFDFRKRGVKQQEAANLISREYIGVIHFYVQTQNLKLHSTPQSSYERVSLFMQMPSEGVGGYWKEDSKLKEDGVFNIGKPHANDATRHLLQWFTFKEGYQYNKGGFYRLDGSQ